MYIPEYFRVQDQESAVRFMRANPFAILISDNAEAPFATHVPVVIRAEGERMTIRGHVAKANPHWQFLQERPKCLMIFHGPHAYVSTSNYAARENVPTWNYGAVHAYGEARVFSEPEQLLQVLHDLIPTFEAAYAEQWESLSEAYRSRMLSHIVGFEITVSEVEAKFKLSQNRTKEEQQKVIESLSAASDTTISGTARLMWQQGLGVCPESKKEK
ncbi:MAG TPA: FMN-binding negative transcriptional regulator [Candidatus Acidoferrales bacterium]|nr:FMN-binding negative transcriptional regulator [Candidatus Acidoferrales bacterium]